MSSLRVLAACALTLALMSAGCSGGDDDAGTATTTTGASASSSTTATSGSPTSAGVAPSTTAAPAVAVVLGPDRLVVGGNALVYGAPRSQVRAYLDRALGAPSDTAVQECGPGRVESFRWKGISAYVDETGFAGWAVDDTTFATDQGIRIGSARRAVEAAHPGLVVTEGSLGTEFFVPGAEDGTGLSGVFEGGAVEAMWSGVTCVAR
jgi:hypothetical protein